jgi:pyridoxamine 5'-phosphate oxidase
VPEPASVTDMRRSYARGRLEEADLAADWVTQFTRWFAEAVASGQLSEPNAMVVATATPGGQPRTRASRCCSPGCRWSGRWW